MDLSGLFFFRVKNGVIYILPTSPRVTLPNLLALAQTIWAPVYRVSKKLGDAGLHRLRMGRVWPPNTSLPQMLLCRIWSLQVKLFGPK